MAVAELLVNVVASTASFSKGMMSISRETQKMSRQISRAGAELSKISAPFAAIGAFSVQFGVQFESAFAGVRKTVNATEGEFAQFRKGILDMSKKVPIAATEIAGVAEAAGQLGIKNKNLLSFTRTMADLGVATNMSSGQAADSLARFANITGMAQENFDRLGSTIVHLGNNFATTESEIVEMSMRLAGAGTAAGLSETEILAFSTALTSVGVNAEAGGTAFSKLFKKIKTAVVTGNDLLPALANVVGMTADEFKEAYEKDASNAIFTFIDALGKTKEPILELQALGMTEIRLSDSMLRTALSSDLMKEALEQSADAWKRNTALAKEASERYKTTASRFQIFKNYLGAVADTIFLALKPSIDSLIDAGVGLAIAFINLDPWLQKTIIAFGTIVAVGGPALFIFGKLITTTIATAAAFKLLGAGLLTLAKTGFALLLSPIGLFTVAIVAAGAAIYIFRDDIKEALGKAKEAIISFFNESKVFFKKGVAGLVIMWEQLVRDMKLTALKIEGVWKDTTSEQIKVYKDFEAKRKKIIDDLNKGLQEERDELAKNKQAVKENVAEKEELLKTTKGVNEETKSHSKTFLEYLENLKGDNAGTKESNKLKKEKARLAREEAKAEKLAAKALKEKANARKEENVQLAQQISLAISSLNLGSGSGSEIFSTFGSVFSAITSSDKFVSGLQNVIDGGFSMDSLFGGGRPDGVQGPLMESGNFTGGMFSTDPGGLFSGAGTAGAYISAVGPILQGISQLGKGTVETMSGIGGAAGSAFGAAFGGPLGATFGNQIGSLLGKGIGKGIKKVFGSGSQNPGTLARREFEKSFNKLLENKNIKILDSEGMLVEFDKFNVGAKDRWKEAGWADEFKEFAGDATGSFLAVGEGLRKIFGITEDIGAQMGVALGEQLGGSLENLGRVLIGLEIPVTDFESAFMEMLKSGEMGVREYIVALQGIRGAFAKAEEAAKNVDVAVEMLLQTTGDSYESIKVIGALAKAAKEEGIESIDALRDRLISSGQLTEDQVKVLMDALAAHGITSVEAFAGATEETLASILAFMSTIAIEGGTIFFDLYKDAEENFDKISEEAKKTANDVQNSFDGVESPSAQASVTPSAQGNVFVNGSLLKRFAKGGVVSKPTFFNIGSMAEEGPEAIMPLKRMSDGDLGIKAEGAGSESIVVNIDARGAEIGVEKRIERKILEVMNRKSRFRGNML